VYIGSRFRGLSGAIAALSGILLLPFSVLMLLGLGYYYLNMKMAVDRVLAGVITASAGMALSMGFKIAGAYSRDPAAMVLAGASFIAMSVFHVRLVPLVLVVGPLAMAWYWPRNSKP
jgi:chromate transporter